MTMTKKIAVSAFAAALMAGSSFAYAADNKGTGTNDGPTIEQKNELVDPTDTGSIGGTMLNADDIGAWQTGDYKVVTLSEIADQTSSLKTKIEEMKMKNPDEVAQLQASISANAALSARLQADNVQISNIVYAEKAADGSVTFYVQ